MGGANEKKHNCVYAVGSESLFFSICAREAILIGFKQVVSLRLMIHVKAIWSPFF